MHDTVVTLEYPSGIVLDVHLSINTRTLSPSDSPESTMFSKPRLRISA